MKSRRPNYRLVKIHRTYSVEEAATVLSVHKNTVREWIKQGLQTCDVKRPTLILGQHLVEFLRQRRERNRRPCQPGQMYCVRCRAPKSPAGGMVEYQPMTVKSWKPDSYLSGLPLDNEPPLQSRSIGTNSGRSGHHVSAPARRLSGSCRITVNSDFQAYMRSRTQPSQPTFWYGSSHPAM
jgi:hypothetical protein